jgi:hypothetical protein
LTLPSWALLGGGTMFGLKWLFGAPKPINEHTLALNVAALEGGANEMNIADVKECIKHTLDELAKESPKAVRALLKKHRKA